MWATFVLGDTKGKEKKREEEGGKKRWLTFKDLSFHLKRRP